MELLKSLAYKGPISLRNRSQSQILINFRSTNLFSTSEMNFFLPKSLIIRTLFILFNSWGNLILNFKHSKKIIAYIGQTILDKGECRKSFSYLPKKYHVSAWWKSELEYFFLETLRIFSLALQWHSIADHLKTILMSKYTKNIMLWCLPFPCL